MRCGYIRWIWDCGNTREVEEKHTGRYGARGQKRQKKGKSLKQCIAEILKYAFKNQVPVDKEIIKAAGVNAGKVTFGDPDMGTAKKLIRDYYLGGSRK